MLNDSFYIVVSAENQSDFKYKTKIRLNPGHVIFKGHFPGFPILPGVASVQIVKEITENILGKSLCLLSADNIKFLLPVNPVDNPVLDIEIYITKIDLDNYKVNSTIFNTRNTPVFKLQGAIYK
jgi:3-hydroxyacyl-[acyl-carrier-protein] dehydratase